MKTIIGLCIASAVIVAGLVWNAMRLPDEYGTFAGVETVKVVDLIDRPGDFLHKNLSIQGVVREQCTTMGCYFFFLEGDKKLRVDLQDIAMNAPRRNGHIAKVEGQVVPYGDGYQFVASAVEFE
jgi:hypothetical protein